MFETLQNPFFIAVVSFAISALLTLAVREFAQKKGFVAKPKSDRWHKRPTALLGGVAIYLTTVSTYFLFVTPQFETLIILLGSSVLFLVGLIDDILTVKPYQKLIGQFIGASLIVGFGLVLQWTDSEFINIAITFFWLIGITNAINLLDNMDGLAAGVTAIAALALAVGLGSSGEISELSLIALFIGALAGFLIFNFNPASIFMGDCGSLFIGFLLASSVLLNQVGGRSRSIMSVIAVPALILLVPIFDTTFVTILRRLWGRKVSQGGRDHTSHRLVALGLSERSAVLMLYGLALFAGLISIFVRQIEITKSLALITVFVIILTIIGVYLSKVKVYEQQEEELATENNAVFGFLLDLSHKRRFFEVILDAFLITLSYYASYIFIWGSIEGTENWDIFIKSVPILIVFNLGAFLLVGVYRGMWRYTGIGDFLTFAQGVIYGSVGSVLAILLLYRFFHFSRAVFFLNGILLFFALAGSRMAFRLIRQVLPPNNKQEGIKVIIYGAGDGGELILREIYNNPNLNYHPIAFVDDNPMKTGKVIHGLKVFDTNGSVSKICRENDVEEILVSFKNVSPEKLDNLKEVSSELGVKLKRALLKIESL